MVDSEVKEKLTYDDRRKVLVQEKSQIIENRLPEEGDEGKLMSTTEQSMKNTYTEDGIRLAFENLKKQKEVFEKRMESLEAKFENEVKLTDEEVALKKSLKRIQQSESVEKARSEYDDVAKELKTIEKGLSDIKATIGDRLKL